MKSFAGTTILLTGASSGIGEAMARQLAAHRPTLLLTARRTALLEALAADGRAAGATVVLYPQDLAAPDGAQALWDRLSADGHTVDVLLNNAGFGRVGPFERHPVADYAQMNTLHVTALVTLTRLALPGMLERRRGGILNVASTASFQALPYFAVYAATKAYIRSFSEGLHAEVRDRGVHVTCLCPGPTKSGFMEAADQNPQFFSLAETSESVAKAGLAALLRNEVTHVPGLANKVGALLPRFIPTGPALGLTKTLMRSLLLKKEDRPSS